MRVVAWAVVRVLGGEAVGVFVHVQGTDAYGARGAHPRDQEGVGRGCRPFALDFRAGNGDHALEVEQVLHRIGHARQRRQQPTLASGGVDSLGLGQRALGGDGREGVEPGVA